MDCGLPDIVYARLDCPDGTDYGSRCKFECRPPARRIGAFTNPLLILLNGDILVKIQKIRLKSQGIQFDLEFKHLCSRFFPMQLYVCESFNLMQACRLLVINQTEAIITWEGNIFTRVCLFKRGSTFPQCHGAGRRPYKQTPLYRQPPPPAHYGKQAGVTHPTGMHSCL